MRNKLIIIVASALTPFPALASTAEQATKFDLICTGEARFTPSERPRSVQHRYRVNIDEMRWCWEACERTFPLASATVDRITFNQEPDGGGYSSYVSRIDGSYSRANFSRRGSWVADRGTCEPAPFSGMPQPKF
jgi:hypothetical protein